MTPLYKADATFCAVLKRGSCEEDRFVFGSLTVVRDSQELSFVTLEHPARPSKIVGKTAIPKGKYPLIWQQSPKFGWCYQIAEVPGFQRILIHPGNTVSDSQGCVLIGTRREGDRLLESRVAFEKLNNFLQHKDGFIDIVSF